MNRKVVKNNQINKKELGIKRGRNKLLLFKL